MQSLVRCRLCELSSSSGDGQAHVGYLQPCKKKQASPMQKHAVRAYHAVDMSPTINQHSACEKGELSGHTNGGGRIQGCGGGRLL